MPKAKSRQKTARPNGYIIYEDSQRVVIATGFKKASTNKKTGKMIQIWILVRDQNPVQAVQTGADKVICFDCPLRGPVCYVDLGKAPYQIWECYQRGGYPVLTDYSVFNGRRTRFGAYGDPVVIPFPILAAIAAASKGITGYTHQWHNPLYAAYNRFLMASVQSLDGKAQAQAAGWRTFRVSKALDKAQDEVVCVNTTKGISCDKCLLCAGNSRPAKSIVIEVHGEGKKKFAAAVAA